EIILELQDLTDSLEQKVWSFLDVAIQEFPCDFPRQCHFSRNSSSDQCDIDAHLLNYIFISASHQQFSLTLLHQYSVIPLPLYLVTLAFQDNDPPDTYASYSDVFCRLHYSLPQDKHHHEDRPDLLGERHEFYMLFVEPKVSQTLFGEPTIYLCLVAATKDHLLSRDTTDIVVQVQRLFVVEQW
nr:hypothetical protein [Tanacetum cinerariifolium]